MKKLFVLSILIIALNNIFAQAPQGISYQAVVRDNQGNVIANHPVKFRFTILKDSHNGEPVFQEIQNVTTNSLGIANTTIGYGIPHIGNFSTHKCYVEI